MSCISANNQDLGIVSSFCGSAVHDEVKPGLKRWPGVAGSQVGRHASPRNLRLRRTLLASFMRGTAEYGRLHRTSTSVSEFGASLRFYSAKGS